MNRLNDAYYQKPQSNIEQQNSYNESLTYDKNGNIITLDRYGNYDTGLFAYQIDDLAYNYDVKSNLLLKVTDTANPYIGFIDGTVNGVDDYVYDANGNMVRDNNKNISRIIYNHLNLPTVIEFSGSGTIFYFYNAAGVKLKKEVRTLVSFASTITTTDYLGGFQYENTILQFFPHAEGYVKNTLNKIGSPTFDYVYNYTDHLGNIRLSYTLDPQTNVLKILEENHYYPFGLKHTNYNTYKKIFKKEDPPTEAPPTSVPGLLMFSVSIRQVVPGELLVYKYKYNGKEWQDELGLNEYNYGFRNYDPAIGRFMVVDPMAEIGLNLSLSPYNYAINNPVKFIDPDGMKWKDPSEAEDLKKDIGKSKASLQKSINKIKDKLDNKNLSEKSRTRKENRVSNLTARIEKLDMAVNDIDVLGADPKHTYDLVSGGEVNYVRRGADGVINIQGPNNALHIHEIRHVAKALGSENGLQFSFGGLLKPALSSNGMLDEMDAYSIQWGYSPSSIPGSVSNEGNVDWTSLAKLKDEKGNYVYPALQQRYSNQKAQEKINKKNQRNRKKNGS